MSQLIEFAGNHLILVGAFFFVLTMLITNLIQAGASRAVLPIQAVQLLNKDDARPLDIRNKSEFEQGHIINAMHVPSAEIKNRLEELKAYKERPLLVYCATGTTSAAAMRELTAAGFENLYSLKGGIAAWRTDNLPLTKDR